MQSDHDSITNTDEELIEPPSGFEWVFFEWSQRNCSEKVDLIRESQSLIGFHQEALTGIKVRVGTGFKTVLGGTPLTQGGKYYFAIKVLEGSRIKIGVASFQQNLEQLGWGIYNGESRHGSNSSGTKYGRVLKVGDIVGVMLDTIEGVLSFTCNRESWGQAFKDEALKKEVLYPAVSLIFLGDSVSALQPQPED